MTVNFRQLSDQLERIYSGRLALRPVCLSDAWSLFEATRNPIFNKHLLWEQPGDEQQLLGRIDAVVDASRLGRLAAVSAVVKRTGEWVSLFRFQPYAQDPLAMEMGVWTHDRFWHGRYSLELGRLCVDAAFRHSNVTRLVGAASPENRGSCHLMGCVGMTSGDLVTRFAESGAPITLQEFSITRNAWLGQTGNRVSFSAFPHPAEVLVRPPLTAVARTMRERNEELVAA